MQDLSSQPYRFSHIWYIVKIYITVKIQVGFYGLWVAVGKKLSSFNILKFQDVGVKIWY